jgi:serine/threonine-protein kinase
MAPEQATADPGTDHRADIYAFGVLAYELLAGRPPFQHATMQGLIAAHVTTPPERLSVHRPSVPPVLEALVMRCLEKRAADRWQSATEIVAQLENLPVSGASTPAGVEPAGSPVRRRMPAYAWLLALLPVAGLVAWLVTRGGATTPTDENLVLALPFRVTATAPEIQNLREGIVDILQASMGGSTGPRVVAAQTAIGAWRRAGGGAEADLADADAERLAQGLGAGSVLTGSIVQQGSGFVMNGSLTPVGGGRTLQGSVEGPVDSTLALVGRLVGQLLSLQAGEEAGRASSLAGVPLPALQAYLDGQRAWRAARWVDALDGFARALAADSTFALAGIYHSLASGWNLGSPASPGPAIARRHLDRLSERDRVLAETVALNRAAELRLGETGLPDLVTLAGRTWVVATTGAATEAGLVEMDIAVTAQGGGAGARIVTFVEGGRP